MKKQKKKFWEMTTAELAEATKEFDQEFIADKTRPMNATERAEERDARKRGRPQVGMGSEGINISIERNLLKKTDSLAKRKGLNRSQIIASGLEAILRRKAS